MLKLFVRTSCLSGILNLGMDELCGGRGLGSGGLFPQGCNLDLYCQRRSSLNYLVVEPIIEQGPCSMVELKKSLPEEWQKALIKNRTHNESRTMMMHSAISKQWLNTCYVSRGCVPNCDV